jgi:hypothetical protein
MLVSRFDYNLSDPAGRCPKGIVGRVITTDRFLRCKFNCKLLLEILSESSAGKRTNSLPNSKLTVFFDF